MDYALALEAAAVSRNKNINETIEKGDSDIQKFYHDAVIFITGGSGFLGTQLVEKFFRSCKIKKIYLLLRPNKKNTINQRLAKMIKYPVYDELHKKQPNFSHKIIPVDGDVNKTRLGISDEMWNLLTEEVDIIVHGAATVNFVQDLKTATLINVKGTIEMLNLGKACKRLKSYVHISTAYSHATHNRIKNEVLEKFYATPLNPSTLIDLVESLGEEKLNRITPQLIEGWPNTYTFTKAVAEEAVRIMAGDLPICIVRPAIVICSYREPVPGWIDKTCVNGASGVPIGIGLGIVHVIYADLNVKLDFVPVDMVNNAIIAAGWRTSVTKHNTPKIYTVTGMSNSMTLGFFNSLLKSDTGGCQIQTDRAVWYCCGMTTKSKLIFFLLSWIFHYIPAYFVDTILFMIGQKLSLVRIYKKAYRMNLILGYFLTNDWNFDDVNLQALHRNLSSTDQIIYNFDTTAIDRKEQMLLWLIGLRRYYVKDGLNNAEWGIKKQFYFKIGHYTILLFYFYLLFKIGFTIISILIYAFYSCYSFMSC